jgi:hypothetical protein
MIRPLLAAALFAVPAAAAAQSAAEKLAALDTRITRLEDANAIERVQRTYGYFVDKAMWTEVSDLFAEDGTLEIGGRGIFVGRARVLEYLQKGLGTERPTENRLINHMQFQPIVTVDPDGRTGHLRGRAFVMSAIQSFAGWGIPLYENGFIKEGGVWKIKSLRGPFTMYTNYEGWAKVATPNTRPDSFLPPPDRLPTEVYLTYPSPYIVPFHFPHPITGKPIDTTVDIAGDRPAP